MKSLAFSLALGLALSACATQRDRYADAGTGYDGPIQASPMVDTRYAAAGANWRMSIDGQMMTLTTDAGFRATDTLVNFTPGHTAGDTYQGERMTVMAEVGRCTIGEMGQTYPHRVTVTLGDQTFRGCGQNSIVPPSGRSN